MRKKKTEPREVTIPDACGGDFAYTAVRYDNVPLRWLIEELRREDADTHD